MTSFPVAGLSAESTAGSGLLTMQVAGLVTDGIGIGNSIQAAVLACQLIVSPPWTNTVPQPTDVVQTTGFRQCTVSKQT